MGICQWFCCGKQRIDFTAPVQTTPPERRSRSQRRKRSSSHSPVHKRQRNRSRGGTPRKGQTMDHLPHYFHSLYILLPCTSNIVHFLSLGYLLSHMSHSSCCIQTCRTVLRGYILLSIHMFAVLGCMLYHCCMLRSMHCRCSYHTNNNLHYYTTRSPNDSFRSRSSVSS